MDPNTSAQQPPGQRPAPAAPPTPEETERQARIAYLQTIAPPPKQNASMWPKILIGFVILLVIGAAAYWFLLRKTGTATDDKTDKQSQLVSKGKTQTDKPIVKKHFDSVHFNLGFDYPDTWEVADDGNGRLVALSKTMQLKTAAGQTNNGQIQLIIQPKQSTLKEFSRGNAVATLESEKISYTKPTQSQRAQTYISYVHYPSTTNDGIDAIYITGDIGYQKEQAIPMVDIVRVDPLITVSFMQCPASPCDGGQTPMTLDKSAWTSASSRIASEVKTILTSLSIQ